MDRKRSRSTGHWTALGLVLLGVAGAPGVAAATPAQGKSRAITWLLLHQNPTGSYGADPRGEVLATASALRALRAAGVSLPQVRRAESWLASQAPASTDDLSQVVLGLDGSDLALDAASFAADLAARQVVRAAGSLVDPGLPPPGTVPIDNEFGWAAYTGERTNLVDSALALRALRQSSYAIPNLASSIAHLRETQNTSGGDAGGWPLARRLRWAQIVSWTGYSTAVASEVASTAEVIRAAKLLVTNDANLNTDINEAVTWLRGQQNADGGWGKGGASSVAETAMVYLALREAGIAAGDADLAQALDSYLLPRQISSASNPNFGSWSGDVVATALALEAIESSGLATDTDGDGTPNASDTDDDGDGVPDATDAYPLIASESADRDGDGVGDVADPDRDGDGFCDPGEAGAECSGTDAFPNDPNASLDADGDGIPDAYDADIDGDGVLNTADVFPFDRNESLDFDRDGRGDNADADDDNDGLPDAVETHTGVWAYSLDTGSNPKDGDTDGDGEIDGDDGYVLDPAHTVVLFGDLNRIPEPGGGPYVGLLDFLIFRRTYGLDASNPRFHPDADIGSVDGSINGVDWAWFSWVFGGNP